MLSRFNIPVLLFLLCFLAGGLCRAEEVSAGWKMTLEGLKPKAEAGDAKVQFLVSGFYKAGIGTIRDDVEAARWARKAAEQGHVKAMSDMGLYYDRGEGVPQNHLLSAMWFRKAAEGGDLIAQVYLGEYYREGLGGLKKDAAEAFKWFTKAADKGHEVALYYVGEAYLTGSGVAQDDKKALIAFGQSAILLYEPAIDKLGLMVVQGRGLKERNAREGVVLIHVAAKRGYAPSQYQLGYAYENGEGVKKNISVAKKWYELAAIKGHTSAIEAVERLATRR